MNTINNMDIQQYLILHQFYAFHAFVSRPNLWVRPAACIRNMRMQGNAGSSVPRIARRTIAFCVVRKKHAARSCADCAERDGFPQCAIHYR
jgi:hypothetical protein